MIHLLLSLICVCAFLTVAAGVSQVGRDLIMGCGSDGPSSSSWLSQFSDMALPDDAATISTAAPVDPDKAQ